MACPPQNFWTWPSHARLWLDGPSPLTEPGAWKQEHQTHFLVSFPRAGWRPLSWVCPLGRRTRDGSPGLALVGSGFLLAVTFLLMCPI